MRHQKLFNKSLFIFRRDIRLHDNRGLIQALHQSQEVIPCFIFDPQQVEDENSYKSENALEFMIEALQDLDAQLRDRQGRLYLFYGDPAACVAQIAKKIKIDALFINRDYTPFSRKRDQALAAQAKKANITFIMCNDLLLTDPESVLTKAGSYYKTYTPFFKAARTIPVEQPKRLPVAHWYSDFLPGQQADTVYAKIQTSHNKLLAAHGTHKDAQRVLTSLKQFGAYAKERNIPSLETTHLSAYLKFGLLSVRQVYHEMVSSLGKQNPLVAQLYWRDFFTHQLFHAPYLLGHAGISKYDALHWSYNKKHFQAWCDGMTGFPIVDAGMRQLNATGFMHNRVRMIVASFLTKDVGIDWRWGERYFAQKLVDYDPALNNGNWQWVASTGTCSQPYFRVFNPWLQQKTYDPECKYIKRWIPELKNVPAKIIHTLFKCTTPVVAPYPLPILDHAKAAQKAMQRYKQILIHK